MVEPPDNSEDRPAERPAKSGDLLRAAAQKSEAKTDAQPGIDDPLIAATLRLEQEMAATRRAVHARDKFFELTLDMLCIADMDGRFKRLNPAFSLTLGWTTEELMTGSFLDFIHPDDISRTLVVMERLGEGKSLLEFENRYRCKDGSYRWFAWKCVPDEDGSLYASARDVTELKIAENAARERQRDLLNLNEALDRQLATHEQPIATPSPGTPSGSGGALNDVARLNALRQTGLMDSPEEPAFDRWTRQAAHLLNAPVSLVSLVDDHRQFFKSAVGLPEPWATQRETPLTHSFCQHVVTTGQPLMVKNSTEHPVVCDNRAISELGVIAYLGVPLVTQKGQPLGSLCVIDGEPRDWTEADSLLLTDLAASVMAEIEMRLQAFDAQCVAASLREARERLNLALRAGRIGTWDMDLRTGEVNFSPEMNAWLIAEGQEALDDFEDWQRRIHPDDAGGARRAFDDALAGRNDYHSTYRVRRRDGALLWLETRGSFLRDERGRPLRALGVARNITERKRNEAAREEVEQQLRQGENRFRQVVEAAPHAMMMVNARGVMKLVNSQTEQLFGYSREELLNQPVDMLVPEGFRLAHPAQLTGFFNSPTRRAMGAGRDLFGLRKDGSEVPIEIGLNPLVTDEGRFVLASIIDITERKRDEAALQQQATELAEARDRAEDADRLKSAFLANMSHELRTPLNSIIGFTGIILQELAGPLNEEQTTQLGMVRDSARHLLALINDVLDISKIEAGEMQVTFEPFDLRESIDKTVGIMEPLAEKKGLALHVDVKMGIDLLTSDQRRVEQILLNFVNNAVKFTEQGDVRLTVEKKGERVQLRVADTGPGIRPQHLQTLFQPFKQVESGLARNHEGTGLGLAICRRLATLLGGEIHAESNWGQGSTFSVTLPIIGRPLPPNRPSA